jgi:hypothetical protein
MSDRKTHQRIVVIRGTAAASKPFRSRQGTAPQTPVRRTVLIKNNVCVAAKTTG